ncbi:MAG: Bug family tripartite tricarboxylate transporter substrate binding protein [Alphaproteobacteria bacterium]
MTRMLIAIVAALGLAGSGGEAWAWPTKPVRMVVPYGAGSTTDIVPRAMTEQLSARLGQPVLIENRPGAGGTVGAAMVAKAEPDGHTVLVNSSAHVIAPALHPALGYRAADDFVAVIPLGISPNVLVVPPGRFRTARDLAAAAKTRPGALNFSSVGAGTATHISAERFRFSAGIDVVHVPFKGGAEAMTEVIAGRIDFFFGPVGLVLPSVSEGRLTALAVNGTARAAALPDVPTTREAGFPDAEYPIWFGLFLPSKTPADIVARLHRETRAALATPAVRERFASLGVDPMELSADAFDARVRAEIAINAALVKAVGLTAP